MNKEAAIMLTCTRKMLGLTQGKFAALADQEQSRESDYERGFSFPPYEYVKNISVNGPLKNICKTWLIGHHIKEIMEIQSLHNEKHNTYTN